MGLPPNGPLSTPMDMAGIREEGGLSLQHAICEQAEKYDARQLELELKALPRLSIWGKTMPDPWFAAWMEHDKVSRTFAYDYPHGLYQPSNDVFAEMFAEHFGICSPVAERMGVGAPLQSARNDLRNPPTVDKWGFALSAHNCPGDDWRTQHDECYRHHHHHGRETSRHCLQRGGGGIFADLLPAAQRGDARRDGVRPDLRLLLDGRQYLYDVKTLCYTDRYYTQVRVMGSHADSASPVEHRAEL